MCRFVAYLGNNLSMADLLTRSDHSLIMQSYRAREREEPLNGDGFGIGWYNHGVDETPCVFTSITPAWSNRNLQSMADKIHSTCFFAHVRAATLGFSVNDLNCHPFQYGKFLWMHNGRIGEFNKIRRRLRESLRDELYDAIQGNTDSEHAFAVFLNHLWPRTEDYSITALQDTMLMTIRQLEDWSAEAGVKTPSYFNFAVTDGHSLVATRYITDSSQHAETLYFASGSKFQCHDGTYRMSDADTADPGAIIVASEPLTMARQYWHPVSQNHVITVTSALQIAHEPIH